MNFKMYFIYLQKYNKITKKNILCNFADLTKMPMIQMKSNFQKKNCVCQV